MKLVPTGNAQVDRVVAALAGELDEKLPGRTHSLYLFGSFADNSHALSSDIDLFVVLKGELAEEEGARIRPIRDGLARLAARHVDLLPVAETQLLRDGHWRLEASSLLVAGDDLRDKLPRETLDAYLRRYSHAPYAYMAGELRHVDRLIYPLTRPDPNDQFGGYVDDDEFGAPSLKVFVATVCWIATMLAGFKAGRKVASRAASPRAYREQVGDHWAEFVDAVYRLGKERWGYRVPEGEEERGTLRRLTNAMPDFENHYLGVYRGFLLDQLRRSEPDARLAAIERLGRWVIYPDDEVRDAVEALATTDDEKLRDAARATLDEIKRLSGSV